MQAVSPFGEWVNSPGAGMEPRISKTLFYLGNKFHRNTFKHVPYIKIRYNKENKIIYIYKIFGEICWNRSIPYIKVGFSKVIQSLT